MDDKVRKLKVNKSLYKQYGVTPHVFIHWKSIEEKYLEEINIDITW